MELPPVECSLLGLAPLLRFGDFRPAYPNTNIGNKVLRSEEDEDLDEWDAGCSSLKSDLDAGFELGCGRRRDHPPRQVTVGSSPYKVMQVDYISQDPSTGFLLPSIFLFAFTHPLPRAPLMIPQLNWQRAGLPWGWGN